MQPRSLLSLESIGRLGFASLALLIALPATAIGCGGREESLPAESVHTGDPQALPSTASAIYLASRDGVVRVVRVDAAERTVTALTPGLPAGFVASRFVASSRQDRILVEGKSGAVEEILAGTRTEWRVLDKSSSGGHLYLDKTSPGLELVGMFRTNAAGGEVTPAVTRFEGDEVATPPAASQLTLVGPSYYLTAGETNGHGLAAWTIVAADGSWTRTLPDGVSAYADAVAFDDSVLVREGKACRFFSTVDPEAEPGDLFPCDSLIAPLVLDGTRVSRLKSQGRDLVADLRFTPRDDQELLYNTGTLSAFIGLRSADRVQSLTFVRADGTTVGYEPDGIGPTSGGDWTRAAGEGDRICALLEVSGCAKDAQGTCESDMVDLACFDGQTVLHRRFVRPHAADGARELVLSNDARHLFFRVGGDLHHLDTVTLAESTFSTGDTFLLRDGEPTSVFGRRIGF